MILHTLIYHDHRCEAVESSITDKSNSQNNIIAVIVNMFHLDLGEGHMSDILTTDFQFECDKSSLTAFADFSNSFKLLELAEINHVDNFKEVSTILLSSEYIDKQSLRGPPSY